jgi:hypothetical protein
VLRLTGSRTIRKTGKRTRETLYAITSLTIADAVPEQIAAWLRGHWVIEDRLHWVRDVDYDEGRSQVRTGSGPQVMATLAQHRHRPAPAGRPHQHRHRTATLRPRLQPSRRTTPDVLKHDFDATLLP